MANGTLTLPCPSGCGRVMACIHDEAASAQGPRIEVYRCPDQGCARKVAVVFEPAGALTEEQQGWVEREIARHGAFFPGDYRNGPGLRG